MTSHPHKSLFIVLLLLMSCELVVDVKVPFDATKVVVNALQNPDMRWTVSVTRPNPVVGPDLYFFPPVNDAEVTIHNPDGSTESLELDRNELEGGVFKGKSRPQAGA